MDPLTTSDPSVFTTIVSSFLTLNDGLKVLLIISSFGFSLGLAALGVFYALKRQKLQADMGENGTLLYTIRRYSADDIAVICHGDDNEDYGPLLFEPRHTGSLDLYERSVAYYLRQKLVEADHARELEAARRGMDTQNDGPPDLRA